MGKDVEADRGRDAEMDGQDAADDYIESTACGTASHPCWLVIRTGGLEEFGRHFQPA